MKVCFHLQCFKLTPSGKKEAVWIEQSFSVQSSSAVSSADKVSLNTLEPFSSCTAPFSAPSAAVLAAGLWVNNQRMLCFTRSPALFRLQDPPSVTDWRRKFEKTTLALRGTVCADTFESHESLCCTMCCCWLGCCRRIRTGVAASSCILLLLLLPDLQSSSRKKTQAGSDRLWNSKKRGCEQVNRDTAHCETGSWAGITV